MTSTNWLSQGDSEPAGASAAPDLGTAVKAAAERRRQALRTLLARHGLTPRDLARAAGMPTGNSLYNFLKGRTESLSQQTLERIVAAVPGTTMAELSGLAPAGRHGAASGHLVAITMVAQAGAWRTSTRLPAGDWSAMTFPTGPGIPAPDLFAVRVRTPGAELIYPDGTALVCRPIGGSLDGLPDGARIVIRRERPGRCETTVRELRRHDGVPWLWLRSTHPEHQEPVPLATRDNGADRRSRIGVVTPLGLVLASWRIETGTPGN
jgi:hypothetical protein